MKRLFVTTSVIFVAALFCGCNNFDNNVVESQNIPVEIVATAAGNTSRVALVDNDTDSKKVVWEDTDQFNLTFFKSDGTGKSAVTTAPSALLGGGTSVKFDTTVPSEYPDLVISSGPVSFSGDTYDYTYIAVPAAQPLNTTGHDLSTLPISSKLISNVADSHEVIQLYPMAGLCEMTITDLPNVSGTNKISKITLKASSFGGGMVHGLAATSVLYDIRDLSFSDDSSSATGLSTTITMESATPVDYTTAPTFYFKAIECTTAFSSLKVEIETTDNIKYTRTASVSIRPQKGHITRFGINMASAESANMAAAFAVEWSSGYLTYSSGKYAFADYDQLGLYFKYKSTTGLEITTAEYDATLGTNKILSSSSVTWPNGMSANIYGPIVGSIIGQLSTITSYTDIPLNTGDPCALVAVAEGENSWRLPTKADIEDLCTIGNDNFRIYSKGSDTYTPSDKKPHIIEYTDGAGTIVKLRSATYIGATANNATVTLNSGTNGYNIYFWSSDLFTGSVTNPTAASEPAAATIGYIFSCLSMNYAVATAGTASRLNGNVAISAAYTTPRHAMLNVRCVRTKK